MLKRLFILQRNRGQFANAGELSKALKEDNKLRAAVEVLTKFFLGRTVSGCSSCYMDAYFELLNLSKEKAMQKIETNFTLRAGALLTDVVNYDISKNMTNANISDDLALYHLRTNPSCRKFFTKLPEKVDELLVGFSENKEEKNQVTIDLSVELKALLDSGLSKSAARKSIKTDDITHKMIDAGFKKLGV